MTGIKSHNNINLFHSEELSEIMSKPNGVIARLGVLVYSIIIVLVLVVAVLVKYPESAKGEGIIYVEPSAKPVIALSGGTIDELFIQEGQFVSKNQILGVIKTSLSYKQVLRLESQINKIQENIYKGTFENIYFPSDFSDLGYLQSKCQYLYWKYQQVKMYFDSPKFREIASFLKNSTPNSIDGKFTRNYDFKNTVFIDFNKEFFELFTTFLNELNLISDEIKEWKEKTFLKAPASGKAVFPDVSIKSRQINGGDSLFYIEPIKKTQYAIILLSQENYNRVKVNQEAFINLDGDFMDPVVGRVSSISKILNKDGKFIVKIELDKHKENQSAKYADVRNQLRGKGIIVLKKKSLLEKILKI